MYVNMSQIIQDEFDLPPEFYAKPLALVGLSGLDTVNNAIHKAIWDTFNSTRKTERSAIAFKLIDNAHEFPVVKPKRNSYEWYIPKGILKKNWMNKYLNEIPAVMVIFYDLDWNDLQWNEKIIECASRVQSMRAALEGRNTKIVICLIQNYPPLPAGEDILASERANTLCTTCELNIKSLYILPHDDHLQGYAVRLEDAFYDLAHAFYQTEIRNIKSHREHLIKLNHQYLIVRHQFKMAFLNELRQDNNTAHKHYTHAYNNLLEIRIIDTNATELRTVAGYINYKLCRLMFSINTPRDAISQFRSHTERFKQRLGFKELAFEHYAWMSKQFSIFGDIFDEAVKLGLPAVQTQHPGIYYYQAAQYMITRKRLCHELCKGVDAYPQPDPLNGSNSVEYYGQRPWRRGKDPDLQLENNGIQAIQFREKQFNHSVGITTLYGMAIAQYKTYKCPRMRRHLVVQMADEYYNSEDYGKALTLLSHMIWDYRSERWWYIIAHILEKALKCAYLTANIQDYTSISLEMLGENIPIPVTTKKRIFENLLRLLNKQIPESEPNVVPLKETTNLWRKLVINDSLTVPIDLKNVISCIDCKAKFSKLMYEADEKIILELFIRLNAPFPLNISNISSVLCNSDASNELTVKELNNNASIVFKPNDIKKYHVEFIPDPNDVEKEIQVDSINVTLCNTGNSSLIVKLTGLGNDVNNTCQEFLHFKPSKLLDFENIKPQITAKVVPYNSKLNVKFEHLEPALLQEWYKINVNITNEELCNLKDISFELSLVDDIGIENTEFSFDPTKSVDKLPLRLSLPKLSPKSNENVTFYVKSTTIGEKNLNVRFSFTMMRDKSIASVKCETLKLSVIKPFEIATNFLSVIFESVEKFYVGEKFLIVPTINCLSPQPVIVVNTLLEFEEHVGVVDKCNKKQIHNTVLSNTEAAGEMYVVNVKKKSDQNILIGQYNIKWKRPNGAIVISQTPIIGYTADWIPLDISLSLPAYGFVRTPILVKYYLYNRSHQLIQLDVNMEASDGFMYAGYKQFQTSILPESTKELEYNLYPLIAGSVALPKLVLTVPENNADGSLLKQEQINQLIERNLPTHFFVMPQNKGKPNVSHAGQILNENLVQ